MQAVFAYRAADARGTIENGVVDARSARDAREIIMSRGLYLLEIERREPRSERREPLPVADLALGLRMLADLLESGLSMSRALHAFEELAPRGWRPALPHIRQSVREGRTFASALQSAPIAIPGLVIGIAQAGEAGSGLGFAIRRAANLMEAAAEMRSSIRSALAYPIIVAAAGLVSVGVLMTVVLPRFARILADLGQTLPASTRVVIQSAAIVRASLIPATIVAVVGAAAWKAWVQTSSGRQSWHRLLLRLPLLGAVRPAAAVARMAHSLSALLESGVTIASALAAIGFGILVGTFATTFAQVMVAEILLGISLAFISGSDSALLYETLKREDSELHYARHQGRMSGYAQAGEALGAVFAGVLYATAPLLPFILQIGVWFLALLLTRSLVEPKREIAPHAGHLVEALRTARYAFVENKSLRYTILLNSVLGIASFYPVWLIQPYMQHAGVPLTWFGPVWSVANLTVAFFSLTSHRINGYLGDRFMLIMFLILVGVGYFGLGVVGGLWGFLFYYLLTSMRGLRGPMMLNLTQKECPSANRAGILSLQTLCFRLLFVCTGPMVGMLADRGGVSQAFHFLLYAFLLVTPPLVWLFLRNLPKERQEASRS